IDATKIADGSVTSAEFQRLDATSSIQTQLDNKQALHAFLTAIAALGDPNADRIMFFDDSAGTIAYLTVGSGLNITGTTLTATGAAGANWTASGSTNSLLAGDAYVFNIYASNNFTIGD